MRTMTDLERAIAHLPGHTLVLCRGEDTLISDKRGVAPMVDFWQEGRDLRGYSAADRIVGRAAAMLFIRAGIGALYAETLSEGGLALLQAYHIPVQYGTLTSAIRNRDNTGPCPMEQAVAGVTQIEDGVQRIHRRLAELHAAHP